MTTLRLIDGEAGCPKRCHIWRADRFAKLILLLMPRPHPREGSSKQTPAPANLSGLP
jgi:hypothetical protein